MFIKELHLVNYKRFKLANIRELIYKPTSVNIIIGSNGSGKSSLLSQLTPFPIDKKDFNNGSKTIYISHRGSEYRLQYNDKASFTKDGIELNTGGTNKVQLSLIEEYLEYTKLIDAILLNKKRFTTLSLKERREIFLTISKVNYDFPYKLYNDAKTRARDLKGVIKIQTNKLIELESSLPTTNTYNETTKRVNTLNQTLESLLTELKTIDEVEDPSSNIKKIKDKLNALSNIDIDVNQLPILENKIKYVDKEIEAVNHSIKKLEDLKESSSYELKKELEEIENTVNYLTTMIPLPNYNIPQFDVHLVKDMLSTIFSFNIPLKEIEKYQNEYTYTMKQMEKYKQLIEFTKEKLSNLNQDVSVTCPKCNHSFTLEQEINYYKEKIVNYNQMLSKYEKKIGKLTPFIEEINEYNKINKDLHTIFRENIPLLSYMSQNIESMNIVIHYLEALKNFDKIKERMIELKGNIKGKESVSNLEYIEDELVKLDTKLTELHKEKTTLLKELKEVKRQQDNLSKINKLKDELERYEKQYNDYLIYKLDLEKNKKLEALIQNTKKELSNVRNELYRYDNIRRDYKKLLHEIKEYKARLKIVEDIVNNLSPDTGLIADSINGFIKSFVKRMNILISEVWSYTMYIEYNNYKFPINVNGVSNEDVKESSSGMQDIIDLVFKITLMEYLEMFDYPIYLDEFGKSFDPYHREQAIELIKKLSKKFNQMFIVSHYDNIIFLDGDVISLHIDNVNNTVKDLNKNILIA